MYAYPCNGLEENVIICRMNVLLDKNDHQCYPSWIHSGCYPVRYFYVNNLLDNFHVPDL